jgi:hypothetical protein
MGAHPGQCVGGGKINRDKTHCRHGHPYSPENTVLVVKRNMRLCKTCRKTYYETAKAKRRRESEVAREREN